MSKKITALIILSFILVSVGVVFGAFQLAGILQAKDGIKQSSNHDVTNSDGHHSSNDQASGVVIDLTSQSKVSMDIKDFKYEKPKIKIKKGTIVTWTNQDAIQHNVMKEHDDDDTPHDPPSKDEVKPDVLAGQLLSRGESYSFTFNEVGNNPYHCSPHPYMKGSITVVE
jgi:amicyanin